MTGQECVFQTPKDWNKHTPGEKWALQSVKVTRQNWWHVTARPRRKECPRWKEFLLLNNNTFVKQIQINWM